MANAIEPYSRAMRRLLVSGFEAFGNAARNPTADAVRALSADPELMAIASFVVLPVTWDGAAAVLRARRVREGARAWLGFGVAGPEHRVRVERFAYNEARSSMRDNAGVLRCGEPLRVGGEARFEAQADLADGLRAALEKRGVPVVDSRDAGRYVCNATYYAMASAARSEGFEALFVHVPQTASSGGTIVDATVRAWTREAIVAFEALTRARETVTARA
jgi:pyroglutamyl-peptidase